MTAIDKLELVLRAETTRPQYLDLGLLVETDGSVSVTEESHGYTGSGPNLEAALVDLLGNMGAL